MYRYYDFACIKKLLDISLSPGNIDLQKYFDVEQTNDIEKEEVLNNFFCVTQNTKENSLVSPTHQILMRNRYPVLVHCTLTEIRMNEQR